jgi:hypothetical protein
MADDARQPESLLPYDDWTEAALRQVARDALAHVAAKGLPGEHHFYVTFRTDHPGTTVPPRLKAQYPQEMTVVLQHQFWDLKVDEEADRFSVGLSFGGVGSTLVVPFGAITAFVDPHMKFALRFRPRAPDTAEQAEEAPLPAAMASPDPPGEARVISIDAFRRRAPGKD